MIEVSLPDLLISGNAQDILPAVREYVSEHGIEIFAQPVSEAQGFQESEQDTYSLTWNPFRELQHGAN